MRGNTISFFTAVICFMVAFLSCEVDAQSCVGKCHMSFDPAADCQCNYACAESANCCPDYNELCAISNETIQGIAEELYALDTENNAALEEHVHVDIESNPLLTINPEAYQKNTIAKLITLLDNYDPDARITENITEARLLEEQEFVNAVFDSPVMQRAQKFLVENSLPSGKEQFYKIWFGLYNRGGGIKGSSGFEHVFVGETSNGIVSGFHGWVNYAMQEANGNLTGHNVTHLLDFCGKGWAIECSFNWLGLPKPIGGGFIGTSPEFELSIYTVCWNARPSSMCPISLNGRELNIYSGVTSAGQSEGKQMVATAYTVITPSSIRDCPQPTTVLGHSTTPSSSSSSFINQFGSFISLCCCSCQLLSFIVFEFYLIVH